MAEPMVIREYIDEGEDGTLDKLIAVAERIQREREEAKKEEEQKST
jgi:hypothetical protein